MALYFIILFSNNIFHSEFTFDMPIFFLALSMTCSTLSIEHDIFCLVFELTIPFWAIPFCFLIFSCKTKSPPWHLLIDTVVLNVMMMMMMMMVMMMMMMMMMNCFCGMVDRQKAFSLISSRDHCQRSSPLQISDMLRAGFEPVQNLISGLVEWSCAVLITTMPQCHNEVVQWW